MNNIAENQETSDDGALEMQRTIIRRSLDEIANKLGAEMRGANMT
jgi:hypothetical protein